MESIDETRLWRNLFGLRARGPLIYSFGSIEHYVLEHFESLPMFTFANPDVRAHYVYHLLTRMEAAQFLPGPSAFFLRNRLLYNPTDYSPNIFGFANGFPFPQLNLPGAVNRNNCVIAGTSATSDIYVATDTSAVVGTTAGPCRNNEVDFATDNSAFAVTCATNDVVTDNIDNCGGNNDGDVSTDNSALAGTCATNDVITDNSAVAVTTDNCGGNISTDNTAIAGTIDDNSDVDMDNSAIPAPSTPTDVYVVPVDSAIAAIAGTDEPDGAEPSPDDESDSDTIPQVIDLYAEMVKKQSTISKTAWTDFINGKDVMTDLPVFPPKLMKISKSPNIQTKATAKPARIQTKATVRRALERRKLRRSKRIRNLCKRADPKPVMVDRILAASPATIETCERMAELLDIQSNVAPETWQLVFPQRRSDVAADRTDSIFEEVDALADILDDDDDFPTTVARLRTPKISHAKLAEQLRKKGSITNPDDLPGGSVPRGATVVARHSVLRGYHHFPGEKVGKLRQILYNRMLDSRIYVIRSFPGVDKLFYEVVSEEKFVQEMRSNSRYLIAIASNEISLSAIDKDMYTIWWTKSPICWTQHKDARQLALKYYPQVHRWVDGGATAFTTERCQAVELFELRFRSTTFCDKMTAFLDRITFTLNSTMEEFDIVGYRRNWKDWNPLPASDPDYVFAWILLLIFSISYGDDLLKQFMEGLYNLESRLYPNLKYCRPRAWVLDPVTVFKFLSSRASTKRPLPTSMSRLATLNVTTLDESEESSEKSYGANYWHNKFLSCVYSAKKIYVEAGAKYCLEGKPSQKLGKEKARQKAYSSVLSQFRIGRVVAKDAPLQSLPISFVDLVEKHTAHLPKGMFPAEWDADFYHRVDGFGLKCVNLAAECCYGVNAGPAPDCHLIRFAVSLGTGCALKASNPALFADQLKQVYPSWQFPILNTTPASIAQVLRQHRTAEVNRVLSQRIILDACTFDLEQHISSYLDNYTTQHRHI